MADAVPNPLRKLIEDAQCRTGMIVRIQSTYCACVCWFNFCQESQRGLLGIPATVIADSKSGHIVSQTGTCAQIGKNLGTGGLRGAFDSHASNDSKQSSLFQGFHSNHDSAGTAHPQTAEHHGESTHASVMRSSSMSKDQLEESARSVDATNGSRRKAKNSFF